MNTQKTDILGFDTLWLISILLLLSGLSLSVNTNANDYAVSTDGQWLIAKYDLNGDTKITAAEVSTKRESIFQYMDADSNGDISFSEYLTLDAIKRQAILKARFNKLDLNQDGYVTQAEYRSYTGQFTSMDSNGDGKVTTQELSKNTTNTDVKTTHCLLWFCVRTHR